MPGTLLGVEHDARSFDQEIELGPGDTLVLYTDGVTEASREHPLAPEDLGAVLRASAPDGADAVAREVVRLAEVGAAGAPRTTSRSSSWPSIARSRASNASWASRDLRALLHGVGVDER